ncbi:cell wall hydrolase [Desertibacillus haloalkaliphilus]|uniref:cell wall hydrolase n=1 Tax=Desertibacillus haloalkaliphilus TaxID=1328930 RepID=UPI001C26F62F|nr:cell wall hydrolase [Desertibacillus haloalkaliphilus]MBU8907664.1 cell wall hydrolase [Desertibacillus haloalkaliphilus]
MNKISFIVTLLATLCFVTPTLAYTVQEGDTMSEIAHNHDLTVTELAEANPQVTDLDLIIVGQQLNIHKSNEVQQPRPEVKSSSIEVKADTNDHDLTEEELDLLARIVRAEAQTEPFEGKVAVADVVLNRVESSEFPDTIEEVIYEPRQFEPVMNGQVYKPADEESMEAVEEALTNDRDMSEDSLFFYNPDIATSRWLDTRETTVVIGQHVFKR